MVFATPGMLHAGLSLQIFKKWAEDEKNMVWYGITGKKDACSLMKREIKRSGDEGQG